MGTAIVLIILLAGVALAVRALVKQKKKGGCVGGCGGDCGGCSHCQSSAPTVEPDGEKKNSVRVGK